MARCLGNCELIFFNLHGRSNCVHKIVTDLGVLSVEIGAFRLLERAEDVSIEEIKAKTAGALVVAGEVKVIALANSP